ncbi:hypothetical protein NJH83_14530 [Pseudomonas chlororaphis]|uniref:hypothetical protein n=1 Tax=Pseudomonas chlororaphis TaxID=587753 RepID=UPI00209B86BA|nr:hypothetical protein [Pseudomonas chlororaphis]MCO7611451.1 hypothetical protein [Pseudomonas chlororaphis]
MKCDLSLDKRRKIARAVLEGLHGFQYSWPERAEVYETLDAMAEAHDPKLVMLNGQSGVGISSILETFASKYHDQVIVVRPRICSERINMIGQVLHAIFPFSEFRSHNHVPDSLIAFRKTARKIIVVDDLDIISNQNKMHEVVFDQLSQLAGFPADFTIIMSTRNKKLLRDYSAIKYRTTTLISVSGLISASSTKHVLQGFFEWCNRQYGTDVHPSCMAQYGKREADMPIDRIVFECESLYCAELLEVLSTFNEEGRGVEGEPSLSISHESLPQIRHAAECCAFD